MIAARAAIVARAVMVVAVMTADLDVMGAGTIVARAAKVVVMIAAPARSVHRRVKPRRKAAAACRTSSPARATDLLHRLKRKKGRSERGGLFSWSRCGSKGQSRAVTGERPASASFNA